MTDTLKNLSRTVTDQLIDGGVALQIKEDSLIAPIVGELMRPMDALPNESVESLIKRTNQHFAAAEPNPFAPSMEEAEVLGNPVSIGVDALLNDLKPIAVGIVETIRNRVLPAVNTVFEDAYTATTEAVDRGGVLVDIETDGSENPLWKNPALLSLIQTPNDAAGLEDAQLTKLVFPVLPAETLLDRLHSVNNLLNESVDALLAEKAEHLVCSVYNELFNTGGPVEPIPCPRVKYLIGLLLGISFREDIPEGVSGVDDAGQYRAILDKFVDGCVVHLVRAIQYTESISKSGRLVLEFPDASEMFKAGSRILVNGYIYESWLEAGGSVDAILGAYVSADQPRNGAVILEEKPRLEREWVRRVGLAQSALRDEFERVLVNNLRRAIFAYAEEAGLKVDEKGIEKMYDRSSSINPDNCYSFVRRIVVACLFSDGDYLSVLEEVDAISEKVKGIELEDAIDLAIIDWLVEWALSMVNIKRA